MKGYDYDGVITKGMIPGPDDVIITGRSCSRADVLRTQQDMIRHNVPPGTAVYFMPTAWKAPIGPSGYEGLLKTGMWKALMIDALELEEFFEDDPIQLQAILVHMKGNCKITKVSL